VLKILRLIRGDSTISKREQAFTEWLGMGRKPVQIKMLPKKFVREFKDFVDKEGFIPEQVFNCDETALFWEKMPKEEKALPEYKPMKLE
jgi:hypothetical protein